MASSRRMNSILSYLRADHPLYDLCCDHGRMGLRALIDRQSAQVTFVDQSQSALIALQSHMKTLDPELQARARILCIAAETCAIRPEPSDFIMAGVGVQTIVTIIQALFPQTLSGHRLILAPQQKSQALRAYLRERSFGLVDETVLEEKGRFREIIVVEQTGEAIDLQGRRFAERTDRDSQAYVLYLNRYYGKIEKMRTKWER